MRVQQQPFCDSPFSLANGDLAYFRLGRAGDNDTSTGFSWRFWTELALAAISLLLISKEGLFAEASGPGPMLRVGDQSYMQNRRGSALSLLSYFACQIVKFYGILVPPFVNETDSWMWFTFLIQCRYQKTFRILALGSSCKMNSLASLTLSYCFPMYTTDTLTVFFVTLLIFVLQQGFINQRMNPTFLCYGNCITLYDENSKGYMYARGYVNNIVRFNESTTPKPETYFTVLPKILNEDMEDKNYKARTNPVLFGSEVCLKHVDSGYFVSGSEETREMLDGFKLIMSETFNKDCVFRLLPLRTFEHEGDPIYMNATFLIRNVRHNKGYITVDPDPVEKEKQKRELPIKSSFHLLNQTDGLRDCKLSYDRPTRWKFFLKPPESNFPKQKKYLHQNDYIYFVNSEDNSILSVQRNLNDITYKLKDYNEYEITRALWEVQYNFDRKTKQQQLRLKHILSGKYFNNPLSKTPTKINLKAIIETQNRLPPFEIYINNERFSKVNSRENQLLHGFQIIKAEKREVKEIVSIKGMPAAVWVPYLMNFLKVNTNQRQALLRQFSMIEILIDIIKKGDAPAEDCYNLLYEICKNNIKNKKRCCENNNIQFLLDEPNKYYSQQLLTELLSENYQTDDVIERQITSDRIETFLREYIQIQNIYDIRYMRILRAFTGTYRKSNVRNQHIIFQYFFYVKEKEFAVSKQDLARSTVYHKSGSVEVPLDLKFRFKIENGRVQIVYFQDGTQKISLIQDFEDNKKKFCRQYLYLLGDCMKNRNQKNINDFVQDFSLEILCDILKDPNYESFKGPVLNLIKTAYIDYKPHGRCELYFLNGWSELSFKGSLVSVLPESSPMFFVLDFIRSQISIQKEYYQSYNLILMQTLKLTIQFGFWKHVQQLLTIRNTLQNLIFHETQISQKPDDDDEKKEQDAPVEVRRKTNNIVLSKIMAVEIYRLLLNLQLNLWVSELVTCELEEDIHKHVDEWLEGDNSKWKLDSRFFILASEKNSELMKNSLKLFYRLFNIKKELYQMLAEARGDGVTKTFENEQQEKRFASLITKGKLDEIAVVNEIMDFLIQGHVHLDKDSLLEFTQRFQTILYDKRPNKNFQNLAVKFGLGTRIIDDLAKVNPNRLKQKDYPAVALKMLLLIAIIKNNMANKKTISRSRKDLLNKFLQVQTVSGFFIEFIEELYRNNKHLITDNKQVQILSDQILRATVKAREQNRTFTCCKLINILNVLITLQNKQLELNESIIIFQIFKKQYADLFQPPRNQKEDDIEASALYNIIMYALMTTLNQEAVKQKFLFSYEFDLLLDMLHRFETNWPMKSRIRLYINETWLGGNKDKEKPKKQRQEPKSPSLKTTTDLKKTESALESLRSIDIEEREWGSAEAKILKTCQADLTYALNNVIEDKSIRMEFYDYERNLKEIVTSFKKILLKVSNSMDSLFEKNGKELKELLVSIYWQLYYIKDYCSVDIVIEIEGIKSVFSKLIDRLEIANKIMDPQIFQNILSSITNPQMQSSYVSPTRPRGTSFTREMSFAHAPPLPAPFRSLNSIKAHVPILQKFESHISSASRRRSIAETELAKYLKSLNKSNPKMLSHENMPSSINETVLNKFIKNVIEVNGKDNGVLSDQIKLFIVNFLTESLLKAQKSMGMKRDTEIWYSDLKPEDMQVLQNGQSLYIKYDFDIPKMICSFLEESFHQRYKLFNGVLELGISLIFGGNTQFQNKFLTVFKEDKKNTIFSNLALAVSETLKNIEFFYKSTSKFVEDEDKIEYPTVLRYEFNMDITQIEANRQQRKSSCSLVWKAFRFFQLLCENNNKEMKEYIQNQYDNENKVKYTSINFIEEANKTLFEVIDILKENLQELRKFHIKKQENSQDTILYQSFKTEIQQNLCIIPIIIIQFLIEVCQIPSKKNQTYLCRTNFFETIRKIEQCITSLDKGHSREDRFSDSIRIRDFNNQQVPFFFVMQKKIIVLIRSLLEPNDSFIIEILHKNFSVRAFQFLLKQAFHYAGIVDTSKLSKILSKYEMSSQLLNIISLLIIKKSLNKDKDTAFIINHPSSQTVPTPAMIQMLESRIRSIEVDLYGQALTVYFPYNPLFGFLSNRTKEEIIYRRFQSRTEKLREMLNSRVIIYEEIEYEYKVHAKVINQKSLEKLFKVSLYTSYFILVLLMLFYSVSGQTITLDIIEQKIVFFAASAQFLLALMYVILWGLHQAPLAQSHIKKRDLLQSKAKSFQPQKCLTIVHKVKQKARLLRMIYLQDNKARSVVIFFILSCLSVFLSVRLYAFNLFFMFAQIDVFKNIFAAIMTNAKQLLVVCMFGLTFAYVFAFVTLNSYLIPLYENEQVDIDISKSGGEHCNTIWSCVVSLYTQHIIGEGTPGSETTDYNRFLYDILFISFFGVFFNNIVSGIMIDKFAELRDTREKIENQIRNKCYICAADKSMLEKRSESFETHMSEVHNIWNYYFYMYTLERIKNSNDFTGIEYWIQDKINKDEIEWFPFEKLYKDNILEDKLEKLCERVEQLIELEMSKKQE